MSDTYTKLFSSITASTIVSEPVATRWAWVTMLAMVKPDGNVYGSVPGLARIANLTLDETEAALRTFRAPDRFSRSQEHEGRRIEDIDGGWRLLNHAKYNAIRNEAERAAYKREWDKANRPSGHARAKEVRQSDTQSDKPTIPTPSALALTPKARSKDCAPEGVMFRDVDPQVIADFKALRQRQRAPITATAIAGIAREAAKAGITLQAALTECCERGWRGFKAVWMTPAANSTGALTHVAPKESVVQRATRKAVDYELAERERHGAIGHDDAGSVDAPAGGLWP